jgi:hypothetical protein
MPRRAHPPTQNWRTFLRNQAFAIGTIGPGEAGRLSGELLALVCGWIERVVRFVTKAKVRDGIPSRLMEPSSTLHRLRPYRSSNRIHGRAAYGRRPVPPWPTTLGGDNWTMVDRRLSPYRSRASPKRKLAAFSNFARPATVRTRQANHNPTRRLYRTSATNTPQELMILNAPPYPPPPLRVGRRGQGHENDRSWQMSPPEPPIVAFESAQHPEGVARRRRNRCRAIAAQTRLDTGRRSLG